HIAHAIAPLYTLSLHDALPIYQRPRRARLGERRQQLLEGAGEAGRVGVAADEPRASPDDRVDGADAPGLVRELVEQGHHVHLVRDRKSTRLNSSHVKISYAVFC